MAPEPQVYEHSCSLSSLPNSQDITKTFYMLLLNFCASDCQWYHSWQWFGKAHHICKNIHGTVIHFIFSQVTNTLCPFYCDCMQWGCLQLKNNMIMIILVNVIFFFSIFITFSFLSDNFSFCCRFQLAKHHCICNWNPNLQLVNS